MYSIPGVTGTTFILFGPSYLGVGRTHKCVVQTKIKYLRFHVHVWHFNILLGHYMHHGTVSDFCRGLPMIVSEGRASKFDYIYLLIFQCGEKNYNNYSTILIISWRSVIPVENHRLATSLSILITYSCIEFTSSRTGLWLTCLVVMCTYSIDIGFVSNYIHTRGPHELYRSLGKGIFRRFINFLPNSLL